MIELSKLQKQFIHCLYQSDDNSILSEIKTGKAPKDKLFNIYSKFYYFMVINIVVSY